MNKIAVLTGVLVAGAALTSILDNKSSSKSGLVGQTLLSDDDVNKISEILIKNSTGLATVLIADQNKSWAIKGAAESFPAAAHKIADLLDRLRSAKIVRKMGSAAELAGELGLESATEVEVKTSKATVLRLKLGDSRDGGGQFVTAVTSDGISRADDAYLIDDSMTVYVDEGEWELKTLVDIDQSKIKSVEFKSAGIAIQRVDAESSFSLGGSKKNDHQSKKKEKPSKGNESELVAAEVSSASNLLKNLRFSERVAKGSLAATDAMKAATLTKIETFAGDVFEIKTGKTLVASVASIANPIEGKKIKEEAKEPVEKWFLSIKPIIGPSENNSNRYDYLEKIADQWSFEVPSSVGRKFAKKASDLVKARSKLNAGTKG